MSQRQQTHNLPHPLPADVLHVAMKGSLMLVLPLASSLPGQSPSGLQPPPPGAHPPLPRKAAMPHGKDFPIVQVKAGKRVPGHVACARSISFRHS